MPEWWDQATDDMTFLSDEWHPDEQRWTIASFAASGYRGQGGVDYGKNKVLRANGLLGMDIYDIHNLPPAAGPPRSEVRACARIECACARSCTWTRVHAHVHVQLGGSVACTRTRARARTHAMPFVHAPL